MRVIDLTHPITERFPVYFPWHPATTLERTATYEQHLCEVRRLSIGTHSGTHIDAPSHIFAGRPAMDQYDPSLWVRDALVVDLTPRAPRLEITPDELRRHGVRKGLAVIIKTGWDREFGSADYYTTYPPLSSAAAEYLVSLEIPLVAADTPFTLDVHRILLRHGIPLVTNINNTGALPAGVIRLIAAPLLIAGADGAPARVLAVIDEGHEA